MDPNSLYLPIIIAFVIVLFLGFAVLYIFNISKRRILKEINEKQAQELSFQKDLLESTIRTQEKERARIARELHDEIGSKLNVVNLSFNALKQSIQKGSEYSESMDHIKTSLSQSIVRVRELSHGLYPPILEKFGIQSALKSLAIEINKTGQIKVHMEIEHPWNKMDQEKALHIYRIVQELISNTIKHAEAKNIYIQSELKADALSILYRDDGKGLIDGNKFQNGMGIHNIKSRIRMMKAEMKMKDSSKDGFQIEFLIP